MIILLTHNDAPNPLLLLLLLLCSLLCHGRSAVPIGICTGADVAFSNLSFLFISVTFYTILKAGSLLW